MAFKKVLVVVMVVVSACAGFAHGYTMQQPVPVRTGLTRSFLDVYMRSMSPYDKIRWVLVKNIAWANNAASFVNQPEQPLASPLWITTVAQQTFTALTQGSPRDCHYQERIVDLVDGSHVLEKNAFCSVADATGMVEPKCYTMYEYLPLDSKWSGYF